MNVSWDDEIGIMEKVDPFLMENRIKIETETET